jgi:predicted site-specific integrase-resolvase
MPRASIYARVSTPEQCLENQLYDLREMASRRGYEIVHGCTDVGSGSKAGAQRSPQLQRGAIPKPSLRWRTALMRRHSPAAGFL